MPLPTQKPKGDGWKSLIVGCKGGLDINQDTLTLAQNPGGAVALVNFEPSIYGGYRRISGYTKFDTNAVPGTGSVIGVKIYSGGVIACRDDDIYYSTGAGWGTSIATRPDAVRYRFVRYNRTGTEYLIMVDENNYPARWDGASYTLLNGVGAPANPKYVEEFKNHIFYAGYTSNLGAVSWSAPSNETDFDAASGAGELVVGDVVTGLKKFRDTLYIFTKNRIYKLTGSSLDDFAVLPVTSNIGCIAPDSIQEIYGDLIFLSSDGVRPLSATERIGDVEISTITRPIKSIVLDASLLSNITSVVVRAKGQYRLFYNSVSTAITDGRGIIGAIPRQSESSGAWEWAETLGITPNVCDSHYILANEYIVHGGHDGFVYRQENGNSFNGVNIIANFKTPMIFFDDPSVRKTLYKLTVYYRVEGTFKVFCNIIYDNGITSTLQPEIFQLGAGASGTLVTYGADTSVYGTATYGSIANPQSTDTIYGSGFAAQLNFTSNDMNPSYTIQGFNLQYAAYGRR